MIRRTWIAAAASLLLRAVMIVSPAACAADAPPVPGPPTYRGLPIRASIVDDETGDPVEGVVAVAHWQLVGRGGLLEGNLKIMETVSDSHGIIQFPAWGPLPRPPEGRLDAGQPGLLLFKQGYQYAHLFNVTVIDVDPRDTRASDWDGKTIRLKRAPLWLQDYANQLSLLDGVEMEFAFGYDDCAWKEIPRLLAAVFKLDRSLRDQHFESSITPLKAREHNALREGCGSMEQYLREYMK